MIHEPVGGATRLNVLSEKLDHIKYSARGFTARCPAHEDHANSLSVTEAEDGRILIKCHAGCDTRDVLDAMGLTFADLFPPVAKNRVFRSGKRPSRESAAYPYVDEGGNLLFEVVRTEPKSFYQRRPDGNGGYVTGLGSTRRVLYRLDKLAETASNGFPVILCEGEKDADAVNALGLDICATTAPMGAGKWQEGYTTALLGREVIICPDNDGAGYGHLRACGDALAQAGCHVRVAEVVKADPALADKKGADVSDYLERARDPAQAMLRLIRGAEPFAGEAFEDISAYVLGAFREETARNRLAPALSTGFAKLDGLLGGRLYPGLYVLGAGSGMGKTALAAQIAMAVAAQGRRALFFSLEMSRAEMTARALTRLLFQKDPLRHGGLRMADLLYGAQDAGLDADIRELAGMAALRNLSFIEGGGAFSAEEIAGRVIEHKRIFGSAPAVIVDYLQMLSPASEKAGVDANILALKRLSRQADTPVIAVSSFNRQNYAAAASYAAFKESGAIEYAADVVLALQAHGVGAIADNAASDPSREIDRLTGSVKRQDVRPLELVMLKNRRGAGYGRFRLDFYAGSCFFVENGEAGERRGPPAANFLKKV